MVVSPWNWSYHHKSISTCQGIASFYTNMDMGLGLCFLLALALPILLCHFFFLAGKCSQCQIKNFHGKIEMNNLSYVPTYVCVTGELWIK